QQAGKVYRIGFLANDPTILTTPASAAFRDGLRQNGLVDGDNILIDWRFAEGKTDRYAELAATLVSLRMDLIVASGSSCGKGGDENHPYCDNERIRSYRVGHCRESCAARRQYHRCD